MEGSSERLARVKEVGILTIPVLLELVISSLFGMIDMIMIGNSDIPAITTPSIAAIGITNHMMFIGIALAQALNTGGTAMIARYFGARRYERIEPVVKHIVIITMLVIAIPLVVLGLLFPVQIMTFIGAKADAIAIGESYFKIVILGFLFQAFNLSIFAAMRGVGDTKTPMKVNIFINFLNVIGNYVLIFGKFGFPKLGVLGAGISTSTVQVIGTVILGILILTKKYDKITINLKEKFKFKSDIIKNLLAIGGPAALEQIAFRVGVLMFVRIVSSLGTEVYATHQININIMQFTFAPGQAFGVVAATLVGRSLGENSTEKADQYIKTSRMIATLTGLFICFCMFNWGKNLVALYTDDPAIINSSINIQKLVALIQPFQAAQLTVAGGIRGAGDTKWTLVITFFSVVVIRIATANLLVFHYNLGLIGAWMAMFIDQFTRWLGVRIRYMTGKWKYVKLV
ncbi:MAG: MATE family efflux transporter [Tissierellia bacterium]|nr:MATE family efflux transporter [Tissierellia bacterium]